MSAPALQTLPPELYIRPELFQREKQRIFAEEWILLAPREQLAAPGAYLALGIAGWPVLALTAADGTTRAFRNVCRHQGLPVLDSGGGRCEALRCRYHGWSYDLAGHFTGAPPASAPPDPADPQHDLQPLKLSEAAGLLFVYLGRGPAPSLAPLPAIAGLARLSLRGEHAVEMAANWKLVMEERLGAPPAPGSERAWAWPNLVVERFDAGCIVAELVPRAFRRTRVVVRLYAAPDLGAAAASHRLDDAIAALAVQQAAAERRHGTLEAGSAAGPPQAPDVAAFHGRLRALA